MIFEDLKVIKRAMCSVYKSFVDGADKRIFITDSP